MENHHQVKRTLQLATLTLDSFTKRQSHAKLHDSNPSCNKWSNNNGVKQILFVLWRTSLCCSWMSKEMWSTYNTCHFYCKAITWWIKKQMHVFNFTRDDEFGPWCVMWWKWSQIIFGPNTIVLVTNIVKCNKFVVMETQTFFDFGTFACIITKCILLCQMISLDFEWNSLVLVNGI